MHHPVSAQILILARQPATARAWLAALAGEDCQIWTALEDIPSDLVPEVLLTDLDSSETVGRVETRQSDGQGDGPAETCRVTTRPTELQPLGKTWLDDAPLPSGVIRVGGEAGACDVLLSPESAPGELRLACRLLAEIVRFRRRERAAARTHHWLRQRALTDPLTALPNRRVWEEALAQRLADGSAARACVAIADLDHFKLVNDAHGHDAGDRVLTAAAASLRAGLRGIDLVARLGGDEFGLLLDVPDAAVAAIVLDRLRQSLPEDVERTAGHRVTMSVGWRLGPAADGEPKTAFALADAALGQAKRAGRDRIHGPTSENAT